MISWINSQLTYFRVMILFMVLILLSFFGMIISGLNIMDVRHKVDTTTVMTQTLFDKVKSYNIKEFKDKKIENIDITNISPHSEFINCTFNNVKFTGILMAGKFENCTFENTLFYDCEFAGTSFNELTFSNSEFSSCSFGYSISYRNWTVNNVTLKNNIVYTVFGTQYILSNSTLDNIGEYEDFKTIFVNNVKG